MPKRRFSLRSFVVTLAVATVAMGGPSAGASGYGTVLPNDDTTNYPFDWSAARQQAPGGGAEPVVAQYDYDYFQGWNPNSNNTDSCGYDDKADEPVRAFTFKNGNGRWRVNMSFPKSPQNRRMVGRNLRDARKENSPTIPQGPGVTPQERRDCERTLVYSGVGTPGSWGDFDDSEWLDGVYYLPDDNPPSRNGGDVVAAMHQEFRADFNNEDPYPNCSPGADPIYRCWFGSITAAHSLPAAGCPVRIGAPPNDTPNVLGACFQRSGEEEDAVIATIPYDYYKDWGCPADLNPSPPAGDGKACGRHGYKEHSNIIKGVGDEAGHYMLAIVSGPHEDKNDQPTKQEAGLCLLRTSDESLAPDSWYAWNGTGFNARPVNDNAAPDDNICKPVADGLIPYSLTYNRYLKKYMVLGTGLQGATTATGVYYMLSDDLRTWSDRQRMMEAPTRDGAIGQCKDGVTYPVVLDPNDPANPTSATAPWPLPAVDPDFSPNFERPGAQPDLYFTHLDVTEPDDPGECTTDHGTVMVGNPPHEEEWQAANIARLPVDFRPQRQATLENGIIDPTWGFDSGEGCAPPPAACVPLMFSQVQGSDTQPQKWGYGERDLSNAGSQKFAQAQLLGSYAPKPHGTINVNWKNQDDVWYGAAYFLPSNFQNTERNIEVLRWDSASSGDFGGVGLKKSDHKFHLVRGSIAFGDSFDLPTGRWTWLEVHQKFGPAGDPAFSEVFVDGRLVSSSTSPNRWTSAPISRLGVGYASADPNYFAYEQMFVDRVSILGGQRGAFKGPAPDQAPEAPTGLKASLLPVSVSLSANAVPDPTGYKFYRRVAGGEWSLIATTGSPDYEDIPAQQCNANYEYRITSYRHTASYVESTVSTPVVVKSPGCP